MVIICSNAIIGPRVKVYGPQCGGLYKEYHRPIIPWSGTDPDVKMNCITWSKEDNDYIVPERQYDEEFKN